MNLAEHVVTASGYSRTVWVHQNPSADRLAVFLDAEYYLKLMNVSPILSALPISAVFVSHIDGAHRHADFTCNPDYSRFITSGVMSWVGKELPGIKDEGHLICGLSLSGLASAHLWLNYPRLFSDALCQSGSFWWNEEWLTSQLGSFEPNGRVWVSVGDKELEKGISHPPTGLHQYESQFVACENFARELERVGGEVQFQTFSGGHDLACWRAELPDALGWLLS